MALTLSEIQALTQDVWMPGSANNWIMGNIMMYKLLQKAQTAPSGEKVRQVLEYAKSRGGAMGPTTKFNTAKKKIFNAARYEWAYFWAGVTYDIEDEVQVNGGDSEVDLIMGKLDNAQSTIKDYMGDSVWTAYATSVTTYGAETKPFYGIEDLMTSSGAYGGIAAADLGTFTRLNASANIWAPFEDASAYVMSFPTLQLLSRSCRVGTDNGKEVLDLIVTTSVLKDAFEAGLQAQQRHYDADLAKAGFDHVNLRTNTPVVVDDKCPANYVNGFNTNTIFLRPHQDYNFTEPIWKEPTDQPIKTTQIIWSGAFTCSARRANGRMTTVSAS